MHAGIDHIKIDHINFERLIIYIKKIIALLSFYSVIRLAAGFRVWTSTPDIKGELNGLVKTRCRKDGS